MDVETEARSSSMIAQCHMAGHWPRQNSDLLFLGRQIFPTTLLNASPLDAGPPRCLSLYLGVMQLWFLPDIFTEFNKCMGHWERRCR